MIGKTRFFDQKVNDAGDLVEIEREKDTVYVSNKENLFKLEYKEGDFVNGEVKMNLDEWESIKGSLHKLFINTVILCPPRPQV